MFNRESPTAPSALPRVNRSRFYRAALARAGKLLKNPRRLNLLVRDAVQKIENRDNGPVERLREGLYTAFRLLKAFSSGQYRQVSWYNLMLIVAALVYFVMPVDMIPDFIVTAGLLDDAMLLTWTLRQMAEEMEHFKAWESLDASAKPSGDAFDGAPMPPAAVKAPDA